MNGGVHALLALHGARYAYNVSIKMAGQPPHAGAIRDIDHRAAGALFQPRG
jgi:hypothetical protein